MTGWCHTETNNQFTIILLPSDSKAFVPHTSDDMQCMDEIHKANHSSFFPDCNLVLDVLHWTRRLWYIHWNERGAGRRCRNSVSQYLRSVIGYLHFENWVWNDIGSFFSEHHPSNDTASVLIDMFSGYEFQQLSAIGDLTRVLKHENNGHFVIVHLAQVTF